MSFVEEEGEKENLAFFLLLGLVSLPHFLRLLFLLVRRNQARGAAAAAAREPPRDARLIKFI